MRSSALQSVFSFENLWPAFAVSSIAAARLTLLVEPNQEGM
jgi:hypothetical protein